MVESLTIVLGESPSVSVESDSLSHEEVLGAVEKLLKKYFMKNGSTPDLRRDVA